jgi:stage II sporulation protein D
LKAPFAALLLAVTGLFTPACLQPVRRELPPTPLEPNPAPARTAPTEITLRLSQFEGADRLVLADAAGEELRFQTEGLKLRCSTGALRNEFLLRPSARALCIDGFPYPGALRIFLRPEGGMRAELSVDLEEYITGVLAGELPLLRSQNAELEAQAVAARSYVLARLKERRTSSLGVFMWDDTRDQVYKPLREARSAPERAAQARLLAAVSATSGEILTHGGTIFDARYHASCGGNTSSSNKIPGSASVQCPGCSEASLGPTKWGFTATPEDLARVAEGLGIGDRVVTIEPTKTLPEGRWTEAHLIGNTGSCTTSMNKLRALVGGDRFLSNDIERLWPHPGEAISSGLRIEGRGRGHGVGLCQDGAHELASRGWTRDQILKHYYPSTQLQLCSSARLL